MFDTKFLLVILLLAVIVFGTKRLRSIGSDLGGSIKSFNQAMREDEASTTKSVAGIEGDR